MKFKNKQANKTKLIKGKHSTLMVQYTRDKNQN